MKTSKDNFVKAVRRFMEMKTLTLAMLRVLIDKIEVHHITGTGKSSAQQIVIHYCFVDRLDIPDIVPRPYYILDARQGATRIPT